MFRRLANCYALSCIICSGTLAACGLQPAGINPSAYEAAVASDISRDATRYKLKYITAPEAQGYTLSTGSSSDLWYPSDFDSRSYEWTITDFSKSSHQTYDVPPPCKKCQAPESLDVVYGPDKRVWFGQCCQPYFGAMDGSGKTQYYPAGKACASSACGIVVGAVSQGNIWYVAVSSSQSTAIVNVGYVNAQSGKVTAFKVSGSLGPAAGEIVLGSDNNFWFADGYDIGRVTPKGVVSLFPTQYYESAQEIIAGPDGDLWYSSPNAIFIARMDTNGNPLDTFDVKSGYIRQLALGPDKHVWLTETTALLRMTSPTTYQAFPIKQKGASCQAHGIGIGPDGNLWFSQTGYSTSGTCALGLGTVVPE